MTCTEARRLLSEHLDDEVETTNRVSDHLVRCADCRAWQAEAADLVSRLSPVTMIHAAPSGNELPRPRRFWILRAARLSLAWTGIVLIAFNLPDLFAPGVDIEYTHLARHQSAFSMALGISFLFVAWRPDRAYGLVPIAAVFAVMLAGATLDLVNGASTLSREAIHFAEIAGLIVVWVLGVNAGPGRRRETSTTLRSVQD